MLHYQIPTIAIECDCNKGQLKEKALHEFLGYEYHKDNLAYDKGSDLVHNGKNISIKSLHFSLANELKANNNNQSTFNELIEQYFSKVHSDTFIYITNDYIAYQMNANEFKQFLMLFSHLEKNDEGLYKIRGKRNTKAIKAYLQEQSI